MDGGGTKANITYKIIATILVYYLQNTLTKFFLLYRYVHVTL